MESRKDIKTTERMHKALGNRRRLMIVKYLEKVGQASVGTIAEEINLSFKSTSRHLSLLAGSELLEREQTSTTVQYQLARPLHPILRTTLHIL